jgi:hypothetical protein
MATLDRMRAVLARQGAAYGRSDDEPLETYAGAMTAYAGLVATIVTAARLSGRPVPEVGLRDALFIPLATHKLSRLVSRGTVTSPVRAPFTTFHGAAGESELAEEVRGSGARRAVGELVTCPFCLSQWIATGFAAGLVLAPQLTRLVAFTMSTVAVSDGLQLGYARLQRAAHGDEGPGEGGDA